MIGKIREFNFNKLFFLTCFALLVTSYIKENYLFFGVFILFYLISLISTKHGLKLLKKLNFLQSIRDEGPNSHFEKLNTPTIGGFFIIIPFLILLLIISLNSDFEKVILLLFCVFSFFLIGFLDDYLSIRNKKNTGLKSTQKFTLQSIVSIIFIVIAFEKGHLDPLITISSNWFIDTNFMIIPISYFTLVGLSNSVNITDGLDGLASGCSTIVFFGLGTEIILNNSQEQIMFSIMCYSMSGLCLGFLNFNRYPAKIFMGDTGSLSIGAILGAIAILTNSFFTLFIISGIFIIESLSVIIQVSFFKVTKKLFNKGQRVFLMAPLHHHYELKGFKEEKIVQNIWIINILLVIFGIVLKINL